MKINNDISKVEKLKLENRKKCISQKRFEKFLSFPMDHRVSISSSSMDVLNDPLHWMIIEEENQKWNFQSRKVEVGKSKKIISQKMFEKILSVPTDHRASI